MRFPVAFYPCSGNIKIRHFSRRGIIIVSPGPGRSVCHVLCRSSRFCRSDICQIYCLSALLKLPAEHRNADGHKDSDDSSDNQKLAKRKAFLIPFHRCLLLPKYLEHIHCTSEKNDRSSSSFSAEVAFLISGCIASITVWFFRILRCLCC